MESQDNGCAQMIVMVVAELKWTYQKDVGSPLLAMIVLIVGVSGSPQKKESVQKNA